MATIRRRGRTWQVQVRRQGFPLLTRTFRQKSHATLWARRTEAELDRGVVPLDIRMLRTITVGDLLERYRRR